MSRNDVKVSYEPLWFLLIKRNIKKSELQRRTGISASTFTKMSKNEYVSLDVLARLCISLDCGLDDIVSIIQ